MIQQQGTEAFPALFSMVNDANIQSVQSMLEELLAVEPTYFLVDIKIKPTNNIKIYLDGDEGITIEKCVRFNRALYKKIEEAGLYPDGDFSLEVSSPGVEEPLRLHRQYSKNINRKVEVLLLDGTKREGRLAAVTEDGILVEETKGRQAGAKPNGKKVEIINHTILFNDIKTTKIQVVF